MTPLTHNQKQMLRKMREPMYANGFRSFGCYGRYQWIDVCPCPNTATANGLISRKLVELRDGVYQLTEAGLNLEL